MKVLLINDSHSVTGGAENYFFDLKSRLRNTPGIQVYSLGFGHARESGADFQIFKAARSNVAKLFWRLIPNLLLYLKIKRLFKQMQPDIIHIHNVRQYSATMLRAIKPYRVVQTTHDHGLVCPFSQNIHTDQQPCGNGFSKSCFWKHQIKESKLAYLLLVLSFFLTRKLTAQSVNAFITVSPGLASILKNHYDLPIQYVPPFRVQQQQTIAPLSELNHFLFAGNIGKHKGIHLLIQEFALASQANPNIFLNIAGSGPEEAAMRKLVAELGIAGRTRFWGWQSALEHFYRDNVALVFPSIGLEGFPLVITEAMSYGRPVIGVNRGTTTWLVEDNKTGLLFDPLKKGDLAKKMLSIAGNAELAQQLGAQGQKRIGELVDNDEALKTIIEVYKSIEQKQ